MTVLGVDAGFDLGPWAAYVAGRHPYALADWHTESWSMMRASGTIPDRGYLYGAPQELRELDEALIILSRQGRVDSAVLDSFRRSVGRFVAVSKEIYENVENPSTGSEEIDWDTEEAPGNLDLISMMLNSSELIRGPEELRLWERCGAIIGEYLLPPSCLISAWRWERPQEGFQALVGTLQGLIQAGDYPFLAELADCLPELDPQAAWQVGMLPLALANARLQRLAELDEKLRHALLSQARPEVWLEFDGERLTFFGARYYVERLPEGEKVHDFQDRLPRTEAAFLWVLADRVGEEVPRTRIREEGELQPGEEELQVTASRLRGKLKPAIAAYCAKKGCKLPDDADVCFIVGKEGGFSESYGPYILMLPPHRVRVSPQRPAWVGPRSAP